MEESSGRERCTTLGFAQLTLQLARHTGLFQRIKRRVFVGIFKPAAFPEVRLHGNGRHLNTPFFMQNGLIE